MENPSTRTMIVVIIATLLVVAATLVVILVRHAQAKRRQERSERNIERSLAEAGAQEALNALHSDSLGMYGRDFAVLKNRLETALASLGTIDRNRVAAWIPPGYIALIEAARDYDNIFDGRSVIDGEVTVYPSDVEPDGFTIGAYSVIVSAASSLRKKTPEMQQIISGIKQVCDRIEKAGMHASKNLKDVVQELTKAHASVNALEAKGYRVKALRTGLKTARGYLTRAETAIGQRNFYTAMDYVTNAEKWIINTETEIENTPETHRALKVKLAGLDAEVAQSLALLTAAQGIMDLLAKKYLAPPLKSARDALNTAAQKGTQLTENAEQFRTNMETLDVYAARGVAHAIDVLIGEIAAAHGQIAELPSQLTAQRAEAHKMHAKLTELIAQVKAEMATRRGRQGQHHKRIDELEALATTQFKRITRNPGVAAGCLSVITTHVRACDSNSQAEDERKNGQISGN